MSLNNLNNQRKSDLIQIMLNTQYKEETYTNPFGLFNSKDFKDGHLGENIPNKHNRSSPPPYHIWVKENSVKINEASIFKEEDKKYMYYLLFGSMPEEIQKDLIKPCGDTSFGTSNANIPDFTDEEIDFLMECLFDPSEMEVA